MKLIPTITTTPGSDWKGKIDEINNLNIEEVAVFVTCLNEEERKNLYSLILRSRIKHIPFVHLRGDMKLSELDYFIKKYNTQIFNLHSEREYAINPELRKYKNIICIENTPNFPFNEEEIGKWGGICLDFSHLENNQLLEEKEYKLNLEVIGKYPIRCNHISAIKEKFMLGGEGKMYYSSHVLNSRGELDYLKKYPLNYFSNFCAIELNNKIKDQLEAIKYINSLFKAQEKQIKELGF